MSAGDSGFAFRISSYRPDHAAMIALELSVNLVYLLVAG